MTRKQPNGYRKRLLGIGTWSHANIREISTDMEKNAVVHDGMLIRGSGLTPDIKMKLSERKEVKLIFTRHAVKLILIIGVSILLPLPAFAEDGHSPYSGQQIREIKALSPDDISDYLKGEGMGLAKAAELNHYPGPRHVLDLSSELNLSEEQRLKTEKIYNAMHESAVRLGKQIVEKEKALDALFNTGSINNKNLEELVRDIARLQGELRVVHLHAHLEMKQILTKEQVEKYDNLRGYGSAENLKSIDHHKHGKH